MAKQPREWTPVETAYSAWLRAAREAAEKGAAVVRGMQSHLERNGLLTEVPKVWGQKYDPSGETRDWRSSYFSQWEKGREGRPPSIPREDALRDALVAVVSGLVDRVPEKAGGWSSFESMFDDLLAERGDSRRRSGDSAKARGKNEREHRDRNLLAVDPVPAKQIDPLTLGLGSWAFDGDLPTYVPRTTDLTLISRLTSDDTHLTVVVGPPKSGKTRSVLQILQDQMPDATLWWITPAPGVIPELVKQAGRTRPDDDRPDVIVLDDAHLNGVNPTDGLTHTRLTALTQVARILVIVHEKDLADWQRQATDRSTDPTRGMAEIGATRELVDLITTNRVDYNPILDDTEIASAADELTRSNHRFDGLDLTRMAEVLASVTQLEDKARAARTTGGVNAALVEAAIDATIAFPTGITIDWLEKLTRIHHRHEAPNKPWKTDLFDTALDWATTGIAPRSPHAILTRSSTDPNNDAYRLLDALTPRLTEPNRALAHLEDIDLPTSAAFYIGGWYKRLAENTAARRWWTKAANHGDTVAMVNLGSLAGDTGDDDTARTWWQKAADHGNAVAMNNLGSLAGGTGDIDTARIWYEEAAERGDTNAQFNLGVLAHQGGDIDTARSWWQKAAECGDTPAMVNLGLISQQGGDIDTARSWWQKAAERGDTPAMVNLGLISQQGGDIDTARTWYEEAAERGDTTAMNTLGNLAHQGGDIDTARTWYEKAADHGHAAAMFNRGALAAETGDTTTAHTWYEKAAKHGNTNAMVNLGGITYQAGDHETARTWWQKGAQRGHTTAMVNIGILAHEAGDVEMARAWWQKAADLGSVNAIKNLRELEGDEDTG
ncbi:tetratricopeptide repeat protein [Rhodococcus sp. AD45]|uniref:tetratricopeptide repeat protein n=1 Tax=Rhodococcus sp. (strain AD45) TaxID=103808 RepID=UPI0005E236D9|nr:tetratricopeptide repeat protein [Rhodococcus sp. AD45]KJF19399.1 Beta-lactamase hcpA precursor [Rhodococcus sp. AD45]